LAGVESAEEWPEITASAESSGQSPEDGIASLGEGEQRRFDQTHQVGIEASYEVDLWGKNRARTQAALERAWASVFDRETVALSLAGDIVRNYLEYLSLNDRIVNAEWTQETLNNLLQAVEERVEGGEATAIQLAQQRTAVANSKSVIPVLELQRELRINALALLLGKSPAEIDIQAQSLVEIKFPTISPGVPSRLILRRPDLRRDEANLIAADADIDVARAELFPTPTLSAEAAYGANSISLLFRPESFFFSIGAAVTQAIFDAGRRQSQIKFEEAQHAELVHNYAQSIYTAVNEVENALVSVELLSKRRELQDQAVTSAKEALSFATEAYDIGAVDYLTMLDTERTLFTERDEFHQVEFDRFVASVDLYLALGGDIDHTLIASTENDSDKESRPPRYFQNEVAYSPVPDLRPNLPKEGHWVHLASLWGERAAWRHWRRMEEKYPTILNDLSPQIHAQQDESVEGNWVTVLLGPYPDVADANNICAALLDRGEGCRTLTR
jgi:multidrug efflux system outer membrane protein